MSLCSTRPGGFNFTPPGRVESSVSPECSTRPGGHAFRYHPAGWKPLDRQNAAPGRVVWHEVHPAGFRAQILEASLRYNVDELTKEAVSRVIVTRADEDMKQIREEFNRQFGVDLRKKIEDVANGNYKDFLLTLIAR